MSHQTGTAEACEKAKKQRLTVVPAAETLALDPAMLTAEDRRRLAAAQGWSRAAEAIRIERRQMREKQRRAEEQRRAERAAELAADPWRQYRAQLAAWRALRRVRKMWRRSSGYPATTPSPSGL